MKRKDLMLIGVIVVFSAVLSLFVSKAIFASPQNRQQQAEVVDPITSDFPKPDDRYFSPPAFNPTKKLNVGQAPNANPFSGTKPH